MLIQAVPKNEITKIFIDSKFWQEGLKSTSSCSGLGWLPITKSLLHYFPKFQITALPSHTLYMRAIYKFNTTFTLTVLFRQRHL
jgi:hypothetical protein